jgi:calcineurin-like phosphoesterase family protein
MRKKGKLRFISDLHLGHYNAMTILDNRGFETLEEMDEYIIKQWNNTVNYDDTIVILGDLSFYDGEKTLSILKRLKGNKILIKGDHDKYLNDPKFDKKVFNYIDRYDEIQDGERRIICSHFPNIFYNGQYRKNKDGEPASYMVYGHIHNTQDMRFLEKVMEMANDFTYINTRNGDQCKIPFNLINCFCVFSNYKPLTLDEWIENQKERSVTC